MNFLNFGRGKIDISNLHKIPKITEKTRTLLLLQQWSATYLARKEDIMDKTDEQDLKQLRDEMNAFVNQMEREWMGKRFDHLSKDNQKMLKDTHMMLRDLVLRTSVRIEDAKQDRVILKKMQTVMSLEDVEGAPERNYLRWAKKPLHYSRKFLASIAKLPQPS